MLTKTIKFYQRKLGDFKTNFENIKCACTQMKELRIMKKRCTDCKHWWVRAVIISQGIKVLAL